MSAFVERQFNIIRNDTKSSARLSVHQPVKTPHGDWACQFELQGFSRPISRKAVGIDSYQALHLAMKYAVSEIAISEEYKQGSLELFDEVISDLVESMGLAPFAHGEA